MIDSIEKVDLDRLLLDDALFVKLANEGREKLGGYPAQSKFRVFAILVIEKTDGSFCLVRGANAEQGYIGGSICAERAALCSLRFLDRPIIRQVVVVTDSDSPTSCGALCREFLMSHASPDTPVVMGNAEGNLVARCALSELWPQPYQYRYTDRATVLDAAKLAGAGLQEIANPDMRKLYEKACSLNALDHADALHPIRFSAAALFDDGSVEVAWQLKGLEYGCTLDAISQLIRDIEKKKYCAPCAVPGDATAVHSHQAGLSVKPVVLVMCDQFGVAHAPFAQARALLYEHGYRYVKILVHDKEGALNAFSVDELVPQPVGTYLVSEEIFTN